MNELKNKRLAASNSFTPEEIKTFDYIISKILLKQNPGDVVRMPGFASLCRKNQVMKATLARLKEARNVEKKDSVDREPLQGGCAEEHDVR
jgi:hypothetical protein